MLPVYSVTYLTGQYPRRGKGRGCGSEEAQGVEQEEEGGEGHAEEEPEVECLSGTDLVSG